MTNETWEVNKFQLTLIIFASIGIGCLLLIGLIELSNYYDRPEQIHVMQPKNRATPYIYGDGINQTVKPVAVYFRYNKYYKHPASIRNPEICPKYF